MGVLDQEVVVAIILFLTCITLYAYRVSIYRWILDRKAANQLLPFFPADQLKRSFSGNIPLQMLNVEGIITDKLSLHSYLQRTFLHPDYIAFTHFMLIGPPGSGRTTTLIKLVRSSFGLDSRSPFELQLFPISHAGLFSLLGQIPNPHQTILMLDGLDEDPEAIMSLKAKMDLLLLHTKAFARVLISCRSGFFPEYMEGAIHEEQLNYIGNDQVQLFKKIYLAPVETKKLKQELRYPIFIQAIAKITTSSNPIHYRYQIWEETCERWIKQNASDSPASKFREQEGWRGWLFDAAEKVYYHLKEGMLPRLSQAEFHELVHKHEISPRKIKGNVIRLYPDNSIGFTHLLILSYVLAKGVFEKRFPVSMLEENWLEDMADYYAEMSITLFFDSIHQAEGSPGYARFAPDYTKAVLESVPIDKYASITHLYLRLYQHLDLRFLYSMSELKRIYLLDGSEEDMRVHLIPQLPLRTYYLYLMPSFGSARIFKATRGNVTEQFFRSSLNPYEAFVSQAAQEAKSWMLNEFETDLKSLPNKQCQLDKVSVQDQHQLLRIYLYTPSKPEWNIFDQIRLLVFSDNQMNVHMTNTILKSDMVENVKALVNRIVHFYSEDDLGKGAFSADDTAQIQDGVWEGRQWAWRRTDTYSHPVHLYMEEPGYLELVIWGVRNEPHNL